MKSLNNSFCTEAHPIFIGSSLPGALESAKEDQEVVYCDADSPYLELARGLWYVYRGEDKPVVATTDSATNVHVYKNCGTECLEAAIYSGPAVKWIANAGVDYFILVSEWFFSTTDLRFDLRILTNDSLENAFGPISPGTNTVVKGSTDGATADDGFPSCGSASAPTAPGVW
jgi:hypothetical protein